MELESIADLLRDTIWTTLALSAPILLTALGTGLVISVFQAATQVNEQTLTFVPKIVATLAAFALVFPIMMATLAEFMTRIIQNVVAGAGP